MRSSERGWVRGAVVIGIAGTMMAVALFSPALAVKLATTGYVKQKVNQAFNKTFSQFLQQPIAYFRSDPIVVPAGVAQNASIGCPPGGAALGGGASSSSTLEDWDLESSYPSNGNTPGAGATGWTVVMENETAAPFSFRIYVVCGGASNIFTNFAPGSPPVRTDADWAPASAAEPTVVTRTVR